LQLAWLMHCFVVVFFRSLLTMVVIGGINIEEYIIYRQDL